MRGRYNERVVSSGFDIIFSLSRIRWLEGSADVLARRERWSVICNRDHFSRTGSYISILGSTGQAFVFKNIHLVHFNF